MGTFNAKNQNFSLSAFLFSKNTNKKIKILFMCTHFLSLSLSISLLFFYETYFFLIKLKIILKWRNRISPAHNKKSLHCLLIKQENASSLCYLLLSSICLPHVNSYFKNIHSKKKKIVNDETHNTQKHTQHLNTRVSPENKKNVSCFSCCDFIVSCLKKPKK